MGNWIMLLVLAISWYVAFSRMTKGEFRLAVLIFLAVAFLAVLLATIGFCSGVPGSTTKAIP